ncbi:MAG TPA: ABC transporter permease subunit [Acidimicrobiales bacterium]|nr:ABC transporter permease subunit [Acidimicrobiales bacterium]
MTSPEAGAAPATPGTGIAIGAPPAPATQPGAAPEASPTAPSGPGSPPPGIVRDRGTASLVARRLASNLSSVLVSIVVILVLWVGFIKLYHIPSLVARNPVDVWRYIFTVKQDKVHALRSAAQNRTILFHNLKTTLRDASVAYVAGIVLALGVSCIFILQRMVEQAFMPVALVLRSVPLIAMAPLLTLIFGRGLMAVTVIGGIVCFFPALVNIMYGLRATPRSALDLMESYGANRFTTLRKVLVPSALPSIFASLRINVPAAMIGALLAEWLATGKGSGDEMLTVVNTFDYGELWAAVVLVTAVAMAAYSVVSAIEAAVLARYAPEATGTRR